MATPRVLTFNFHEPYLCMMAATGLPMDVGQYERGGLARAWHAQFRPVPENLTLVREGVWRERLAAGHYDVVIAQNESNALDVIHGNAARLLVCHNRRTFLQSTIPADNPDGQASFQRLLEQLPHHFEFVFISESKREDYGIPGRVIPPGFDVDAWGGYTGKTACILRVGNTMRQRDRMFDVDFQEACCRDLANRVVGVNPLIPESAPAASFEELLALYRTHRCLLHVSREAYEDGYNLAMLEAMACGMPVCALANPTSPITSGVDGFTAYDSGELRDYLAQLLDDPALAREIGARGRETVAKTFPLDRFAERWRAAIYEAADRKPGGRRTEKPAGASPPTGIPVLMTYIASPHTTGRYIREALRQSHPVVSAGPRVPDSMLLDWGFQPPVPDYPRHDIETGLEPDAQEIAERLPAGFTPRLFLWVDSGQPRLAPAHAGIDAPKAAWFIDTHLGAPHRLEIARHFDFVYLAQKAQVEEFRKAGLKHVEWLPLACAEELHRLPPRERDLDVAFAGSMASASGERRRGFIEAVRAAFPNHFIGQCWPDEMAGYYARAKIVINMCVNQDVNMRVFEAMASGALLVTDPAVGLEDLFEDGRDLAIYRSIDEAIALIRHYLDDEDARARIAAAGQARVLREHTYARRVETLLADIERAAGPLAKPALHHEPKSAEEYYEHPRRELLPVIPRTCRRVLDVGCGAGVLGRVLKAERRVAEVCGIEYVEEAAQRARAVLDRVLHGNIEEMALPWEDGYFDCIVCADVLEHLVNPAAVLAKLKRVLARDGVMVISVPNARFYEVIQMLSHGAWTYCEQGIMDATHLRFFTRTDLGTMIESGGMETAEIRPLNARPASYLPKNADGSLTMGLVTVEDVDEAAYNEVLAYQWLAVACKPGVDRLEDARAALDAGNYEAALGLAVDAVGVDEIARHSLAARALARLNQLEKAEETYRNLLEKTDSPEIQGEYGILLLGMDKAAVAKPYLERALAALPEFDRAEGALGLIAYQAGDLEAAFPRLQRALEASFSNRGLLESYLDVAARLERLEEALPVVQSYLEFYPGNLDLKVTYARLLCALNDYAGAREQLDLVHMFDPAHDGAGELAAAMDREAGEPES